MLSVYPFGTGSLYTGSFAMTASYAMSASAIGYVYTASNAPSVLYEQSGSRGQSVCLITGEEYVTMQANKDLFYVEICDVICACEFLNSYYGPTISDACNSLGTINLYSPTCNSIIYTDGGCNSLFTGYTRSTIGTYNYHLNGVYQGNFVCP